MSENLLEKLYNCNDLICTFNNNNALKKSVFKSSINWYAKVALFISIFKYGKIIIFQSHTSLWQHLRNCYIHVCFECSFQTETTEIWNNWFIKMSSKNKNTLKQYVSGAVASWLYLNYKERLFGIWSWWNVNVWQ